MEPSEKRAIVTLTLAGGLGPILTRRCIEALGSASAVLEAGADRLASISRIGRDRARKIRAEFDRLVEERSVETEIEAADRDGVDMLGPDDEAYPRGLRFMPDRPALLYVRGTLAEDDAVALAIVGARRCTAYGREQADRLAALAAGAGLCVVSGGAYGIDAAAHRGALRGGGRTIAVLGSGLARPYPTEHVKLFDEIAEGRGAVVSEFAMTAAPRAEHFPRRNRIISGLALGVLVIEAAQRSGALLTARLAAEEHGREVMALPGRVDSTASAGCHKMIREGWARLVTNIADVLDGLGEAGTLLRAGIDASVEGGVGAGAEAGRPATSPDLTATLTQSQRRVVESLEQPAGLDQISAATGLAVQVIQADLTMLEIRGLVARSGAVFSRQAAATLLKNQAR